LSQIFEALIQPQDPAVERLEALAIQEPEPLYTLVTSIVNPP